MNTIIAHTRLASQQLQGTSCKTPKDIVAWMGAMQSQDYTMAKWAIGVRLVGCSDTLVEEAFSRGEILRTHVLRPTWHFVSPENIRWMLELTAPKIKVSAKSRDRDLEITEELYVKTNRIIRKALEGNKQLTREEIAEELGNAKIKVDSSRMVHFMMRAESDCIVCSGAMRKKAHTYALVDERAPQAKSLHKNEALAKLARTYFSSHCPATLPDFTWWSGLSATEARQAAEAIKTDFIPEKFNDQTYWVANDFKSQPPTKKSIHLLPAFDEYIISYKDRQTVLPREHHRKAVSSNGIFRPLIVENGQVIGIWKKSTSKKNPLLFDFFGPINFSEKQLLEKAVAAFNTFVGKPSPEKDFLEPH